MTNTVMHLYLGAAALIWLPLSIADNSGSSPRWVKKESIPSTGQDWMSLEKNVEFQPAFDDAARFLGSTSETNGGTGYAQQFIDGQGTLYNDYAQAWRLLGMYIDCNYVYNQRSYRRKLEDQQYNNYEDYYPNQACQRMLLWAAYVDVDYEGGGIGEYSYYDRKNSVWDTSACEATEGAEERRCVKMDCHLPDTHFKLLGYFKEPGYDQWMEQLFKHEGICVWDDDEYEFMQNDRQVWPVNCIATDSVDADGNTLYFDTKPLEQGRMGIGLYTDWRCSQDYEGDISPTEVLQNVDDDYYYNEEVSDSEESGNIYQLETSLETWNDALDVFKVCQPCVAYNLGYIPDEDYNDREGEDEDGNYFDCYDDADYTNVNQCMKFRTHTDMYAATFQDIHMASNQGSIVEVDILGKTYGRGGFTDVQATSYTASSQKTGTRSTGNTFLLVSLMLCVCGMVAFFFAVRMAKKGKLSEPLVRKTGLMA